MKDKTFITVMLIVVFICVMLTVAHLIYGVYAYQHSSIIYFISKELW